MIERFNIHIKHPWRRVLLGIVFGFAFMATATKIFIVNEYDYRNIVRGVTALLQGINPWKAETRIYNFYNPPFSIFFLWPMLWLHPRYLLILGGTLLAGYAFYRGAWVALGWFVSAEMLWLIAAGNIDTYIMGAGLWSLAIGDNLKNQKIRILLYSIGYGFLLIKPQGGIFIVLFHVWLRRNWLAVLLSIFLYVVPFAHLYPDWIKILIIDPPPGQRSEPHTFAGQFGLPFAIILSLIILCSRDWDYWSLGGALAALLPPYGMPAVPIFLILTAANTMKALLMFIFFASGLALLTWNTPPPEIKDYYAYVGKFLRIHHLGLQAYALTLAILAPKYPETINRIDICSMLLKKNKRV